LEHLPMPLQALIVVVLGILLGFLITITSSKFLILALAGIAVTFVALSKPEFVILLLLAASSSILDVQQIPTISVGKSFSVVELCLILLLGLTVIKVLGREFHYVKTPLDLPIALFFLASFISLTNSVVNLGTDVNLMEFQWRILFSYLLFFTVTNLIRTRQQLMTLIAGLFAIATIVALLMIVQQILGPSVVILPGRVEIADVYQVRFTGVTRILPPGQSLVLVMFLPAVLLIIFRQRRTWIDVLLGLSAALLLVGLAFTFTRGFWAGIVVAGAAMFLRVSGEQRKKMILFFCLLLLITIITIPLLSVFSPKAGRVIDALYARVATFAEPNRALNSSSWQYRVEEGKFARLTIQENPWLGVGPGNDYRPQFWSGDRLTHYVHNTYLFILVDMGIVGLIPFIWFTVVFLVRGARLGIVIRDRGLRAIALGFTLSYVAVLIVGIVAPVFMEWYWPPVLAIMFGVNEVIYRFDRQEGS
jgi:O-antigen ligase